MGEKISAFWITTVLLIAILWIALVLAEEPEKEIRPTVTPIPTEVTQTEIESTPPEITREVVKIEEVEDINPSDIELLAKVITTESGADWCKDELQLMVGSVVINRVNDSRFPNTIEEVIYQPGQYSTADRLADIQPTERAMEHAKQLLIEGVTIPESIVWQANFPQHKTYKVLQGVYFGQ